MTFDRFSLEGRTALIAGVGPGIGAHVALAFARAGAAVVLASRSAEKMEGVAAKIESEGGRALPVVADVADAADASRLVERANRAFGPIHILFYNAFFYEGPHAADEDVFFADDAHWQRSFEVNMLAPYRLARLLAPGMHAAGYGSIITVLSCAAFTPTLPQLAYGSTKAGLHMLTRYLARAGGETIRANCLCPGGISPDGSNDHRFAQHIEKNAIRRPGRAEEVVGAALLLASPASSFTTGQVIFCDGGRVNTLA